jgi:hypothetical protein
LPYFFAESRRVAITTQLMQAKLGLTADELVYNSNAAVRLGPLTILQHLLNLLVKLAGGILPTPCLSLQAWGWDALRSLSGDRSWQLTAWQN